MSKKKKRDSISRDNFIEFLANATPQDINDYILEKGKPRRLVDPMIFFDKEDNKKGESVQ